MPTACRMNVVSIKLIPLVCAMFRRTTLTRLSKPMFGLIAKALNDNNALLPKCTRENEASAPRIRRLSSNLGERR